MDLARERFTRIAVLLLNLNAEVSTPTLFWLILRKGIVKGNLVRLQLDVVTEKLNPQHPRAICLHGKMTH